MSDEEKAKCSTQAEWIALYKKYGFYWPTEQDLLQLAAENPKFNLSDLVIEKIRWKKECCGFSMIQLVFSKGVCSPVFKVHDGDETDFLTTNIRNPKEVRYVHVRTAENKYVEKLRFLSEKFPLNEKIPKEKLLADISPCRCG